MDKNECFIANATGMKEMLLQGKEKAIETDCLDLFHVNNLHPSLKSPVELPDDFANGTSGKKLAGYSVQAAVIERNEGKEVSFIKYLHRSF